MIRARSIVLLLALFALACGDDREATTSAPSRDEPRAPRGAEPARCEGASDDPPELDVAWASASSDLESAIASMEAVAGGHSGSSTARSRLGELALRRQPPAASTAERWFDRALALHEEGCTLGERDHWATLEGSALSRMMQGDYAGALPFLRRSLARWPGVRGTRYNLACALCQTGDVEGCARELEAATHGSEAAPDFLHDQDRPAAHYRELARRDPDLAPLRADAARFERTIGAE